MKTRKEALQDEIKIYGDMIRKTEADLREARIDINVKNLKYRINSYKKQIEDDYMEIAEIEEGETKEKIIKFYDEFLTEISSVKLYIEEEKGAIELDESNYDLETARNVVLTELEELRTFVTEGGF